VEFRRDDLAIATRGATIDYLSVPAIVEEWLRGNLALPLILICDFPADVRQTLRSLSSVDHLAGMRIRLVDEIEPTNLKEILDKLAVEISDRRTPPGVIVLDLSGFPPAHGDWQSLWRHLTRFERVAAGWKHPLIAGVPRWLALESKGAYKDIGALVYSSAPFFSPRYAHRSRECATLPRGGIQLGRTLETLLSCNSSGPARVFRDSLDELPDAPGLLEPGTNPRIDRWLCKLAGNFDRSGYHELAYRLELACLTAAGGRRETALAADMRPADHIDEAGLIVEYLPDIKWAPATVCFGRLIGEPGSGKTT
jgi:hypothetical protein